MLILHSLNLPYYCYALIMLVYLSLCCLSFSGMYFLQINPFLFNYRAWNYRAWVEICFRLFLSAK